MREINIKDYQDYQNETVLLVKKIVKIKVDDIGNKIVFYKWEIADETVNLGSLAEPNAEILEFVYIPRRRIKEYFK